MQRNLERDKYLPGYSALRETSRSVTLPSSVYEIAGTTGQPIYQRYLQHPAYDDYLQIHKVLVGESGAEKLIDIADQLSREALPEYLNAAGSAYLEAGLALANQPTAQRVELLNAADSCWEKSLSISQEIANNSRAQELFDDTDQFRSALRLAVSPLMKSLVVGNVTKQAIEHSFADALAVSQTSAIQLGLARQAKEHEAIAAHIGFLHECNTILTLLNYNDPRYIPSPSFERADNGVYYRRQTHDIIIFNQHWGEIKKIIPIEVKGKASRRDRERYQALLVRGRMHLIINNGADPTKILDAFARQHEGVGTIEDEIAVNHASTSLNNLLQLCQQGPKNQQIKTSSTTKFHSPAYVEHLYRGDLHDNH